MVCDRKQGSTLFLHSVAKTSTTLVNTMSITLAFTLKIIFTFCSQGFILSVHKIPTYDNLQSLFGGKCVLDLFCTMNLTCRPIFLDFVGLHVKINSPCNLSAFALITSKFETHGNIFSPYVIKVAFNSLLSIVCEITRF